MGYPRKYNPGGHWLFNPPDPHAYTTVMRDVDRNAAPLPYPAGGVASIPPGYTVNFKGPGRDIFVDTAFAFEDQLTGDFLLYRVDVPVQTSDLGLRYLAVYQSTRKVEGLWPAWTLFFGSVNVTTGPYVVSQGGGFSIDNWPLRNSWFLVADMVPNWASSEIFASHIYQFLSPERDLRSRTGENDPGQWTNYDSLGSNRFLIQPWHWADSQWTAIGGLEENMEVTCHAWWP